MPSPEQGTGPEVNLASATMSTSTGAVWSAARLRAVLEQGDVASFNAHRPKDEKMHVLDLRGIDLSGKELNLTGIDLSYCDLRGANLSGCNLTDAHFEWADLTSGTLNGTLLNHAKFENATLNSAKLEHVRSAQLADFNSARMIQASFDNSNFEGALMQEVKAYGASLNDACFRNAFLYKARFNRSSGKKADFSGEHTVLVGAHFKQSALTEADFSGANAYHAVFSQSNGENLKFKGTNLVKADMRKTIFIGETTFEGAFTSGMLQDGFGASPKDAKKMLEGSLNQEPPAGMFKVRRAQTAQSSLVLGIPNTSRRLMLEAGKLSDQFIGLDGPKENLWQRQSKLRNNLRRAQHGLPTELVSMNSLYIGPTGTGKTEFSKVEAMTDCALGLLNDPEPVIRHRDEFVGDSIGDTEKITAAIMEDVLARRARLVIDELYQLVVKGSDKDYGRQALNVIMRYAEQYRDKIAITGILYPEEIATLRKYNQGFLNRFPNKVYFPHYDDGELVDQLRWRMDNNMDTYDKHILAPASVFLALQRAKEGDAFGNGRAARDLLGKMTDRRSARNDQKTEVTTADLATFVPEDLPFEALLGFPNSEIDYDSLDWVTQDGTKTLDYKGLTKTFRNFPQLTEASVAKLVEQFGSRFPVDAVYEDEDGS